MNFTFFEPCIVIYSTCVVRTNKMHTFFHQWYNSIIVSSTCFEQPNVHHQEDCTSSFVVLCCGEIVIKYRVYTKEWCGKLVVTPTEHQLWRLHSTTGRYSPPHFHRNVRVLLSRVLQQRWIGRAAKGDNHLLPWPPCSPDLTPCRFLSLGVR